MVDLLAQDAAEVGGKAMGLALLGTSGMPVPDAVVIPVRWFWRHLEQSGLDPRVPGGPDAAAIAAALPGTTLDSELAGALREVGASFGPRVAVRSSAVGEDAAAASHAGQYATLLGVRPGDDLEQAVVSCWASAFSGHVQVYREARAGRGSTVAGMAVVVQKMIEPRCAGVVFTINPSTGSWAEMTVEAAWGLGEAVVSGRVVPDFYGVRRPRRLPRVVQRLVAHVRLEETTREVQSQDRQLIGVGSGVEDVPVPVELRAQPKLTTDQVLRLCRLALRVEARAGLPQDIEWAMDDNGAFYVLQARPVTTAREVRPSGAQVWTRRFVGERWTEPATPLGWSLMGGLLDWFVDYPEVSRKYLGGGAATRLYRSAPYLNTTVFRHLAFKAPGTRPPRFMLELLPPHEELDWLRRRAQMPDLRVYGAIFATTFKERRWRRFRWNPVRNPVHWDAYERLLDDALVPMASPCQSRAEAVARTDRCMDLAREYIKVHVCSLLFANLWYEVAGAMLVSRGAGDPDLLLRPAAPTWTVQTAHALWALGAGKLSEPDLLARFGHRSTSSWALFAVRWSEQPEMVRQLVESTVGGGDPLPPVVRAVAQADEAMAGRLSRLISMNTKSTTGTGSVLFVPHGAGPLPLLGDKAHQGMVDFLKEIKSEIENPSAIIVISAHWEADKVTITSGKNPPLIYDFSGFPDEAYDIEYPVTGNTQLAEKIYQLLNLNGIDARLDEQRGFDHGLFVPLKIMYPDATIPCVQISLVKTLDPETHIKIGKALAELKNENILIIGSGFTFHNLRAFTQQEINTVDKDNELFENWLVETCTSKAINANERESRLIKWSEAPSARYCHPREEHLLPLHVCYGVSESEARLVFHDDVMGKKRALLCGDYFSICFNVCNKTGEY